MPRAAENTSLRALGLTPRAQPQSRDHLPRSLGSDPAHLTPSNAFRRAVHASTHAHMHDTCLQGVEHCPAPTLKALLFQPPVSCVQSVASLRADGRAHNTLDT